MEFLLLLLFPTLLFVDSGSGSDPTDVGTEPRDPDEPGDFVQGTDNNDLIGGGDGNDTIWGGGGDDTLDGGAGDDTLRGGDHDDILLGDAGDDLLRGGDHRDVLVGGAGQDTLLGDAEHDILVGQTLAEEVDVEGLISNPNVVSILDVLGQTQLSTASEDLSEADEMHGGAGRDIFLMGANDTASGGWQDDWFVASADQSSASVITDFGKGDDQLAITYDGTNGAPEVSITDDGEGNAIVLADGEPIFSVLGQAGNLDLNDIRMFDRTNGEIRFETFGTGLADALVGSDDGDYIDGGAGSDSLYGNSGNDTLIGGLGNDYISGGGDNDSIMGGAGNDYLNGGHGNDTIFGGEGNDRISAGDIWGSDRLYGGDGNDTLSGNTWDQLSGGDGDDVLRVGGTRTYDRYGGSGSPIIRYGANLNGGSGNDLLVAEFDAVQDSTNRGLVNSTQFTGGDGSDTFVADISINPEYGEFFEGGPLVQINDYVAGEDTLVIQTLNDMGEISIVSQANGDALVMLGDTEAMLVVGAGETLTLDDIQLVDTSE
ncbi:MAG: calcium-binding protein [Cognatishimia sp.]